MCPSQSHHCKEMGRIYGLNVDIHVIRSNEIDMELRAEWDVYWKLPQVLFSDGLRVLDWWQQMGHLMPKLMCIACRSLAMPATSCDGERSFSSLK